MADDDDRVIKDTDQATSSIAETSSSSSSSAAAAVVAARDQIPITPEGNDEGIDDDLERAQTAGGASYSAFTISQKRWIVVMVAIAAFFSPLSANIYFPSLGTLSKQLNVSTELINLTITSYMIFQGIAPTFFGDLADMVGRRPVYIVCFIVYIGANIGLALQRNYVALLILRMMQSSGSSAVIALANGVVADIAHAGERGMYMGMVNLGAMGGPAVGPVLGGIIANEAGWWWIFWLLVILSSTFFVFLLFFFPETGRMVVGDGSIPPTGINVNLVTLLSRAAARKKRHQEYPDRVSIAESQVATKRPLRFPNPFDCIKLIFHKDVGLVLFCNALIYTVFYCVTASTATLFAQIYHFNELQIGLCYIPFGAGAAVSSVLAGRIIDRDYRVVALAHGITPDRRRGDDLDSFPLEKARLRSVFWLVGLYMFLLIGYGWVIQAETNLAGPLVLQFFMGIVGTSIFNILSVFIVDMYPLKPASATACNNFVRCLMGAGGTAVIDAMINSMGRGWCFTFLGLISGLQVPLLFVERKYGMGWRKARVGRERERLTRIKEAADQACARSVSEKSVEAGVGGEGR